MSSYWSTDNIVQIGESKVEIPAENGLSYSGGQKVSLFVPPTVEFVDGKKSFLQFDLKLALDSTKSPTLLQLDHAGGGILIKNMRIYDGTRGNLIEEINEYSSLLAMKYDYDTDDSARSLRAMEEGGTAHSRLNQGTLGNIRSEYTDTFTNPYFKVGAGKSAVMSDADFTTAKCCVPLHAGVFSGKMFPVMMSGGLYIELDLQPASRVVKQLDTAIAGRKLQLNPVFHSLNGSLTGPTNWGQTGALDSVGIQTAGADYTDDTYSGVATTGGTGTGATLDLTIAGGVITVVAISDPGVGYTVGDLLVPDPAVVGTPSTPGAIEVVTAVTGTDVIYLTQDNNLFGGERTDACPFVIGESITLVKESNQLEATLSAEFIISEINACATNGLIELKSATTIDQTSGEPIIRDEWRVVSVSVCGPSGSANSSYNATYTMSNVNLVCHKVDLDPKFKAGMMAKIREGKAIEFDIHSVTTYKNSLLASDRQTSFLVHASNSRAKSILISPTDSSVYTSAQLISASGTYSIAENEADLTLNSNRSGYVGCCDFLSSVQYQIDGKLVPSRPISTKKCATRNSVDAFHLFELEKSLDNAGITPRSFTKFLDNWVLGRGFAIGSGAMDLRGKDLSVLLKYEETSAPTKPKMINSFVFHIRRLVMRGSGAVEVVA